MYHTYAIRVKERVNPQSTVMRVFV